MIYILLPVHSRCEITRRFIECLKVQTYREFHLVLIDDGSNDGTVEMVSENISALTVIRGAGNWWWAGALQQGYLWLMKQSLPTTDLVVIINDDTEFEADFLEKSIAFMQYRTQTLLQAQCYSSQDGRLLDTGVHVDWRKLSHEVTNNPKRVNCLSTNALFLTLADFITIGGFYPRILPHYLSDYEFTIRAHHKGMSLCTDSTVKLLLNEETTASRKKYSGSLFEQLWQIFSKGSVRNPFFWMVYIILACPWPWKPFCMVRVLIRAFRDISSIFFYVKREH